MIEIEFVAPIDAHCHLHNGQYIYIYVGRKIQAGENIKKGQSNYRRSILATASQKIKSKETPCPRQSRLIFVRCCPVEIIHPVAAANKLVADQAQPCLSFLSIGLPIFRRHQVSKAELIRIPSDKSKGNSKNNVIRSFCGMLYATACHDAGGLPIDRLQMAYVENEWTEWTQLVKIS